MKKTLIFNVLGLSILASSSALATTYSFPCPDINKNQVTNSQNGTVFYAPSVTLGMPQNLVGTADGVTAAWIGLVIGQAYATVDYNSSTFAEVSADPQGPVYCIYTIKGTNSANEPLSQTVYLQPGNSEYKNLYTYSLSSGTSWSTDMNTTIIAQDSQ